jgi:hypothetical protein
MNCGSTAAIQSGAFLEEAFCANKNIIQVNVGNACHTRTLKAIAYSGWLK